MQGVFDVVQFLFDFCLGLGFQVFVFGMGLVVGFIDDLVSVFFCLFDDFGCLSFGFVQLLVCFFMSQFQIMSCVVGSVQVVSDFFLMFLQSCDDWRLYEFYVEQYKDEECNGLVNQGCINVYVNILFVCCLLNI